MRIEGSVPIFPTEDPDKVVMGVLNLFPGSECQIGADGIVFRSGSARHLCEVLEDQRIRDTALMVLRRSQVEDSTSFYLNKQAAFMGKANFTEGKSSLGDIRVEVMEGARELMEGIAPGP
jgi:hypothetical protein